MNIRLFRCPRCAKGPLYHGLLKISAGCAACGLSFGEHEQGDGPAFFSITIVGGVVAILASIVEIRYEPPFWVHAAIWIPAIVAGSLAVLRIAKAAIIHAQYRVRQNDFTL